jgi:hypothetical protein
VSDEEPIDRQPCIASGRPDHRHAWRFDGDDPYVLCDYCGERRDALTGRAIRPPERKQSNVAGALAVLRRAAEEVPDEAVRETRKIALRVIEKELQLLRAQRDAYIRRLDEEVKTI